MQKYCGADAAAVKKVCTVQDPTETAKAVARCGDPPAHKKVPLTYIAPPPPGEDHGGVKAEFHSQWRSNNVTVVVR